MATIDLTRPDNPDVAAYFVGIHLDDLLTDDPEIVAAAPEDCHYCDRTPPPRLVPWFMLCWHCATGETCDHAGTDRITGTGWTACEACGEIIEEN